eukprot:Clim_evm14s224 gene=Clim_evmTU14s224
MQWTLRTGVFGLFQAVWLSLLLVPTVEGKGSVRASLRAEWHANNLFSEMLECIGLVDDVDETLYFRSLDIMAVAGDSIGTWTDERFWAETTFVALRSMRGDAAYNLVQECMVSGHMSAKVAAQHSLAPANCGGVTPCLCINNRAGAVSEVDVDTGSILETASGLITGKSWDPEADNAKCDATLLDTDHVRYVGAESVSNNDALPLILYLVLGEKNHMGAYQVLLEKLASAQGTKFAVAIRSSPLAHGKGRRNAFSQPLGHAFTLNVKSSEYNTRDSLASVNSTVNSTLANDLRGMTYMANETNPDAVYDRLLEHLRDSNGTEGPVSPDGLYQECGPGRMALATLRDIKCSPLKEALLARDVAHKPAPHRWQAPDGPEDVTSMEHPISIRLAAYSLMTAQKFATDVVKDLVIDDGPVTSRRLRKGGMHPEMDRLALLHDLTHNLPLVAGLLEELAPKAFEGFVENGSLGDLARKDLRIAQAHGRINFSGPEKSILPDLRVNGISISPTDLTVHHILPMLAQDTRMLSRLGSLGYSADEATQLLVAQITHTADFAPLMDMRNAAVYFLNDIEKDPEYASIMNTKVVDLLKADVENAPVKKIRKNLFTLILAFDPTHENSEDIVRFLIAMLKTGVEAPIRLGVMLIESSQSCDAEGYNSAGAVLHLSFLTALKKDGALEALNWLLFAQEEHENGRPYTVDSVRNTLKSSIDEHVSKVIAAANNKSEAGRTENFKDVFELVEMRRQMCSQVHSIGIGNSPGSTFVFGNGRLARADTPREVENLSMKLYNIAMQKLTKDVQVGAVDDKTDLNNYWQFVSYASSYGGSATGRTNIPYARYNAKVMVGATSGERGYLYPTVPLDEMSRLHKVHQGDERQDGKETVAISAGVPASHWVFPKGYGIDEKGYFPDVIKTIAVVVDLESSTGRMTALSSLQYLQRAAADDASSMTGEVREKHRPAETAIPAADLYTRLLIVPAKHRGQDPKIPGPFTEAYIRLLVSLEVDNELSNDVHKRREHLLHFFEAAAVSRTAEDLTGHVKERSMKGTSQPLSVSSVESASHIERAMQVSIDENAKSTLWQNFRDISSSFLGRAEAASGEFVVAVNGRIYGPFGETELLKMEDIHLMTTVEANHRLKNVLSVVQGSAVHIGERDHGKVANSRELKIWNTTLQALIVLSEVPASHGDPMPLRSHGFSKAATVNIAEREQHLPRHEISLVFDPLSEEAPAALDLALWITTTVNARMQVYIVVPPSLQEDSVTNGIAQRGSEYPLPLPPMRFYRSSIGGLNDSVVAFSGDTMDSHTLGRSAVSGVILRLALTEPRFGKVRAARLQQQVNFCSVPDDTVYTLDVRAPTAWVTVLKEGVADFDNIYFAPFGRKGSQLQHHDDHVAAVYGLTGLAIEGEMIEGGLQRPARGLQLELGTFSEESGDVVVDDTVTIHNTAYYQLTAPPGYFSLRLKKGTQSENIYRLTNVLSHAHLGEAVQKTSTLPISVVSLVSPYYAVGVMKKEGKEHEALLAVPDPFSPNPPPSAEQTLSTDKVNVFSVGSGHLYERMLGIVMTSAKDSMKDAESTELHFWILDRYISPRFRSLLPHLESELGVTIHLVNYQWPNWLGPTPYPRRRIIEAYKILFLDVLFPQDTDRVVFMDADHVVREDLTELMAYDLTQNVEGPSDTSVAPYAFTPYCSDRPEMAEHRFWDTGFWHDHLHKNGQTYHSSSLFVVDLGVFRRTLAGDALRKAYLELSNGPHTLRNLDQDLPNYTQHRVAISSLPQQWLWCETWCSDGTKDRAKTINICNNPQTREAKLNAARRIIGQAWDDIDHRIYEKVWLKHWQTSMEDMGAVFRDGTLRAEGVKDRESPIYTGALTGNDTDDDSRDEL